MTKIENLEFMEKSIGSIFNIEKYAPHILVTINRFKKVIEDSLVFEISDLYNPDYKYTHEAILTDVNTLGLFQFTLSMPESISSSTFENDMLASYENYLDDIILNSFENLQPIEASIVVLDLFTLLYCYIVVSEIKLDLKEIMLKGMIKAITLYVHFDGLNEISKTLYDLHKDLHARTIESKH